jgi:hypothetical protein
VFCLPKLNFAEFTFYALCLGSQASVQMYNGAAPLVGGGLKAVPSTCGTNQFWYVGNLTKSGTSYTWTNKNLCTNTAP